MSAWASKENQAAYDRAYRSKFRERISAHKKAYYRTHREGVLARIRTKAYGINEAEIGRLIKEQGGVCGICHKENWGARGPHVDHDHASGLVRGIICHNCNLALGHVHDDLKIIRGMGDYLIKFSKGRRP